MTTQVKSTKSSYDMLQWQYRTLIAELQQIQLHSESGDCPCIMKDLDPPEMCLAKHCLNVSSMASETASMDPDNAKMLWELSEAAAEMHEKVKSFMCKKGDLPDLVPLSRQWRKRIEPLYYRTSCKITLKQEPTCSLASPKPESTVSISGKCGASVDTCQFTIRRKGKPVIVTKEVTETPSTTCKAAPISSLTERTRELLLGKKCSVPLKGSTAKLGQGETPTVRITGTCTAEGCALKVKGALETTERTDAIGLTEAINDAIHHFDKRAGPPKPSSRTFAPGITTQTRYEFEFKVVEAHDLIVSHSPVTFEPNPKYIAKIQPRLRERMANQLQVKKIAARLDPEKLLLDTHAIDTGSPIIGPDNIVECGNGRVLALLIAAKEYPANIELYRAALKGVALNLGLPVAPIDKMKLPVLVRVRLTPVDRQAFAEECNARPTIETSAIEKARTDADKITPAMLQSLDVLEGETIERALRSERNKAFVAAYMSKIPENEQAGLIDSRGYLSSDGIRRMVMGIFTATFKGDTGIKLAEKFFEAIDETGVKNAFNGILKSLGIMAQAENLVASGVREPGLTIGEDLAKAMTVFSNLRGADVSVANYLNQQQLESRQLTPFQETVLKVLDDNSRSAKRVGNILTYYAQAVIDSPPPGQVSMIPMPKPEKAALFAQVVKRVVAEAEAERAEREAKKRKEPEAVMSCGPACTLLLQGHAVIKRNLHKCNLTDRELDLALNWRPLRDLLLMPMGWKAATVELCSVGQGMAAGTYQVTMGGVSSGNAEKVFDFIRKYHQRIRQVYTKEPGQLVFEVVVPEVEAKRELSWTPQEVSHAPARSQGTQAVMLASPLLTALAVAGAYEGAQQIGELGERRDSYSEAREYADKVGKPLLVVGTPKAAFRNHPCGDVTIDITPNIPSECKYQIADVRSIPYPDKHFGAAFISHVLEHLPTIADAVKALNELHRVADKVFVVLPHKSSIAAWLHPEHQLWLKPKGDGFEIEQRGGKGPPVLWRPHSEVNLADPLLATIAHELCSVGMCLASSKLPVCTGAKAAKVESCILNVKARNVEVLMQRGVTRAILPLSEVRDVK